MCRHSISTRPRHAWHPSSTWWPLTSCCFAIVLFLTSGLCTWKKAPEELFSMYPFNSSWPQNRTVPFFCCPYNPLYLSQVYFWHYTILVAHGFFQHPQYRLKFPRFHTDFKILVAHGSLSVPASEADTPQFCLKRLHLLQVQLPNNAFSRQWFLIPGDVSVATGKGFA